MKKIASIFFIFIGLVLLTISSSKNLMKMISSKRTNIDGPFGTHRQASGDLVSMSYLDHVKKFQDKDDEKFFRPAGDTGRRNIDLYIYGDSYLMYVPDSAFGFINSYHFGRRTYQDLNYHLDPHKKNILIIEYSERLTRNELGKLDIFQHLKEKEPENTFLNLSSHPIRSAGLVNLSIFSHEINSNLEFNLYGYRFLDQIKLAKVYLTYGLFKRAVGDVVISDDGSRLFLRQTLAPKDIASSYYPVDRKEMGKMVRNLDSICNHYKADGFDEVYLSIIPNPVTILQPLHYNNLIPELQKPGRIPGLRIINIYDLFLQDPEPGRLFRRSDTHWSNQGIQIWLNTVNAELKRQNLTVH